MNLNRRAFFAVFLVLIGVVTYVLLVAEKKPDKAITMTPKQYIERVEAAKADRLKQKQAEVPAINTSGTSE